MMEKKHIVEETYDDWVELLKRADAMDILKDPFSIWVEAFSTSAILHMARNADIVNNYLNRAIEDPNSTFTGAEVRQMLQQTIVLIQSQGRLS